MAEQYSIDNKFNIVRKLSIEPIGCYYRAVSLDKKEVLLLLLNKEISQIIRAHNLQCFAEHGQDAKPPVFIPILDLVDCAEGVVIVMPYLNGITLSDYINNNESKKLPFIKKMLNPVVIGLSDLHKEKSFYGFLNFSTAWVADDNKVYIIGYGLFNKIFHDVDLPNDETCFKDSRIISCIKSNSLNNKMDCSIYADYYAIYMFFGCLLQGYISSDRKIDTNAIQNNLSNKSKIYLTPTFCGKFCKNEVSINDWILKLEPIKTNFKIYYSVASISVITFASFTWYSFYQIEPQKQINLEKIANNLHKTPIMPAKKQESFTTTTDFGSVCLAVNLDDHDSNFLANSESNKKDNLPISYLEFIDYAFVLKPLAIKTDFLHQSCYINQSECMDIAKLSDSNSNSNIGKESVVENLKSTVTAKTDKYNLFEINNIVNNAIVNFAKNENEIHDVKKITANNQYKNTYDNEYLAEQEHNDLKCSDESCYDLISIGIKGPELSSVNLGDEGSFIMKKPITRHDYYTYCYIDKNCGLISEFDDAVISKCLFSNDCSIELSSWLKQPMEFITSFQVNKYIVWLNNVTRSKYDIISDKYWLELAADLTPVNKCHNNKDNNFIAYDSHPEWVRFNNAIAFRGPVKVIQDGEQCEIKFQLVDAEKYLGKVFVRLVRNA